MGAAAAAAGAVLLAESAITFRKASKAAVEDEVEADPVAAKPLLFICAPALRTDSRSVRGMAAFDLYKYEVHTRTVLT